jgi:uncharacterized coiled-coil protein SlyX
MTRISLLEDQKAIFTAQKVELENKRGDIYVREQQAISDALLPFFKDFSEEVTVEVSRGSVYFKMAHPDYSYLKELFNLYLKENWNFEEKGFSYNGIDLSYYTTSTKGVDAWELRRLRMLGDLAEIVLNNQDKMLDAINSAVLPFKEEYDRVYAQMNLIGKATKELNEKIAAVKKEKIEFDLKNGGVEFEKGVNIQLKFNYSPRIKSIKLIDLSKSGKKATAVFDFGHGNHTSREENVSVSSIIDQVLGFTKNITEKELLTS